jgi:D-mannonate dehydratase
MDWAEYDNSPVDDDRAGTTVDQIFERIEYFLERVVPVAERFEVQLACHLDDPPAPLAVGESVIKCLSPLNVLKDTYDQS